VVLCCTAKQKKKNTTFHFIFLSGLCITQNHYFRGDISRQKLRVLHCKAKKKNTVENNLTKCENCGIINYRVKGGNKMEFENKMDAAKIIREIEFINAKAWEEING